MVNNKEMFILAPDALLGIKDILLKHPAELKLHKLAVIEKLRERIGDDDKLVRETLYQLFKSVIFPGCVKVFNSMVYLMLKVLTLISSYYSLCRYCLHQH